MKEIQTFEKNCEKIIDGIFTLIKDIKTLPYQQMLVPTYHRLFEQLHIFADYYKNTIDISVTKLIAKIESLEKGN